VKADVRRKKDANPESVVPREILERAQRSVESDVVKRHTRCVVCGSECAPNSVEDLCWVCRRLKISAWNETDQQLSAQE